jgi:hypothetical protein
LPRSILTIPPTFLVFPAILPGLVATLPWVGCRWPTTLMLYVNGVTVKLATRQRITPNSKTSFSNYCRLIRSVGSHRKQHSNTNFFDVQGGCIRAMEQVQRDHRQRHHHPHMGPNHDIIFHHTDHRVGGRLHDTMRTAHHAIRSSRTVINSRAITSFHHRRRPSSGQPAFVHHHALTKLPQNWVRPSLCCLIAFHFIPTPNHRRPACILIHKIPPTTARLFITNNSPYYTRCGTPCPSHSNAVLLITINAQS